MVVCAGVQCDGLLCFIVVSILSHSFSLLLSQCDVFNCFFDILFSLTLQPTLLKLFEYITIEANEEADPKRRFKYDIHHPCFLFFCSPLSFLFALPSGTHSLHVKYCVQRSGLSQNQFTEMNLF